MRHNSKGSNDAQIMPNLLKQVTLSTSSETPVGSNFWLRYARILVPVGKL